MTPRRFVVTGGASGIGRATVLAMLAAGYSVGVVDLNESALASLLGECQNAGSARQIAAVRADISNEQSMADAIDGFAQRFDGLDGIVNNAGIGGAFGPITDLRVEDWDATFAVVTRGVLIGTKHTARILIRQGHGGVIVNVGSVAGLAGDAGPQAYSAAKAAVIHMGRVFAAELAPYRIAVNTVSPGLIDTPLNPTGERRTEDSFAKAQPWPEKGRPEHVARAIVFLAGADAGFLTGENLAVDGGLTAVGARLGTEMGTNSLGLGVFGMNYGTTGRPALVRGKAERGS